MPRLLPTANTIEDMTWPIVDGLGRYSLASEVSLVAGATLTIEDGVRIESSLYTDKRIVVSNGTLNATGAFFASTTGTGDRSILIFSGGNAHGTLTDCTFRSRPRKTNPENPVRFG